MRGAVAQYASAWPLIDRLPGLYQEDLLARELTGAFDEVIAPAVGVIDNLPAYLDPATTPEDFLDWLAGWVGLLLDETWPIERRRALVAVAAQLYRNRGTRAGLAMQVRLFTGGEVEIEDSGGAAWSSTSGGAVPGTSDFRVTVRVKPPGKAKLDSARLDALVAAAKPAHISHAVEVAGAPTS
jgi:phage tail-like protein